jgi:hypothetical protein
MDGDIKIYDLQIPYGGSIDFEFLYNDTDGSEGYVGGLPGSPTNLTDLDSANMFGKSPHLQPLGDGRYTFTFSTMDGGLFDAIGGVPEASTVAYRFEVGLWLANRTARFVEIHITIVPVPTSLLVIDESRYIGYGIEGYVVLRFWDEWNDLPVEGANATAFCDNQYILVHTTIPETSPGHYRITFVGTSQIWELVKQPAQGDIEFELSRANHELGTPDDLALDIEVTIVLTPLEETMNTVVPIAFPVSILIVLLLAAYIRVWSVPKRIRQINAQVKALRKGKIPKPIDDVPSRQELLAELFNDTYSEVDIKRAAYHMPEESISVEVPEMGELLIQLSILTHLSAEELEEFKGDISKMRISEQATFVKEVIMQEAMRAARRDGTTVDEVVEQTRAQALRQLKGEEEGFGVIMPSVPEEKPIVLVEEEEKEVLPVVEEEELVAPEEAPPEGPMAPPSEKLSDYEIEELRKELTARGVPPHEIDTIMEQAKVLPRELVDELVKSLGGDKK